MKPISRTTFSAWMLGVACGVSRSNSRESSRSISRTNYRGLLAGVLWGVLSAVSFASCAPLELSGSTTANEVKAPNSLNSGIIGGAKVNASDTLACSTALIFLVHPTKNLSSTCTGVVVAKDLVVTAAHCFYPNWGPSTGYLKYVLFGTYQDMKAPGAFKRAIQIGSSYSVHPDFDLATLKNDVAILRLPPGSAASVAAAQTLLPLPILKSPLPAGSAVTLAGYGAQTSSRADETSNARYTLKFLKTKTLKVSPSDVPQARGVQVSALATPAFGDSGGPALARAANGRLFVWALDTFQDDKIPNTEFYTTLNSYVPWLQTAAKKLGSPAKL